MTIAIFWIGLAIAVANIDAVIALIRGAKDANAAREALMGRDWQAKDMAPLIALIADPRHRLSDKGTYRLSEEQARAILKAAWEQGIRYYDTSPWYGQPTAQEIAVYARCA